MAREFKSADLHEIQDIISAFPFSRRITEVHLHHTWRPRQRDYRGLATIEGMWRYHTETNGWSDIGQHITIAPDGAIWLCRNFNWAPASASGFNGNRSAGPFMIEMIGDFDDGEEAISCEQRDATLAVIKSVHQKFDLHPAAIRFHNEMSAKSCPGTGHDKADWIERIERFQLNQHRSASRDMPFPSRYTRAYELMRGMNPDAEQTDDMSSTEHDGHAVMEESTGETSALRAEHSAGQSPSSNSRSVPDEITTELLEALSGHVVNIERGRFSQSGQLETTLQDVDKIFEELIPAEIDSATSEDEKAQIVFYAHGGLVSERNALLAAAKQLGFWRANGVYPVFFVWETGVAETIRQLISEAASRTQPPSSRGVSDWLTDNVTDPIIEDLARAAGGRLLWAGMKSSAELASQPGKAADHVARKMAQLIDSHGDDVDVHIVGHSAGSIFHSHFMPRLVAGGVNIASAHFLAPAVRNDLFRERVMPLMGKGLGPLTVFTMNKQREKADDVASLYHKSLLYLVSRAFEDEKDADILGLEESLRRDRETRALFGLDGSTSARADVVWSPTPDSHSGNGSSAITHGAFDDDPATMESVLRRLSGLRDGEPITPFPAADSRGALETWQNQFNWPSSHAYLSRWSEAMQSLPVTPAAGTPVAGAAPSPTTQTSDTSAGTVSMPDTASPSIPSSANSTLSGALDTAGNSAETSSSVSTQSIEGLAPHSSTGKKHKKSKAEKKKAKAAKNKKAKAQKGKSDRHDDSPVDSAKAANECSPQRQPRRRALCIGIDTYRRSPLNGCVADAHLWHQTLSSLGYEVELLLNEKATASHIRQGVRELVQNSVAGDNLVLQFAGHGTQFTDRDGDESNGDSPALDECLCAVDCDFADDGLVIDDELREILSTMPDGVSMTCFFDCCHSGSATRAALRMAGDNQGHDVRARFLMPNAHMESVYRHRMKKVRRASSRALMKQRDVLFSACRSTELAYESDGQGDFTRRATDIIRSGIEGISNVEFLERVLAAFGQSPRQNPEIHCDLSNRQGTFLNRVPAASASDSLQSLTERTSQRQTEAS